MTTALRRQLERAERVIHPTASRLIPCAWHALAEIEPRIYVAPDDVFPGSCPECGEDMDFNMAGCTPRERELSTEFYFRGYTFDTLTASRRAFATLLWLSTAGGRLQPDRARSTSGRLSKSMTGAWAISGRRISSR